MIAFGLAGWLPVLSDSYNVEPALRTEAVSADPDDPAIWVHPTDGARSLIIGTNKVKAPDGALVVFDLRGKIVQTVAGLDRPNNVDIEYGLRLNGQDTDVAVTTERPEKPATDFPNRKK